MVSITPEAVSINHDKSHINFLVLCATLEHDQTDAIDVSNELRRKIKEHHSSKDLVSMARRNQKLYIWCR